MENQSVTALTNLTPVKQADNVEAVPEERTRASTPSPPGKTSIMAVAKFVVITTKETFMAHILKHDHSSLTYLHRGPLPPMAEIQFKAPV